MLRLLLLLPCLLAACAPRVELGTPCESAAQCPEPFVCRLGRCRSECRVQRDCPPGVTCVLDTSGLGSCRLPSEETCAGTSECPAGLACFEGSCANACTSPSECPDGSRCDGMPRHCIRDDGPPVDAPSPPDTPACIGPRCLPIFEVAVSDRATAALTGSGAVLAWGLASMAGLPDTTLLCSADPRPCAPRPVFVEVEGAVPLVDVRTLSGNAFSFCAATPLSTSCWGLMVGPLGGPGDGSIPRPVRLSASDAPGGVVTLSRSAALLEAAGGGVLGWGDASFGELGDGMASTSIVARTVAPPAGAMTGLRLGSWHGCAVQSGRVYCWGENDFGQAGVSGAGPGVIVPADAMRPVVGLPSGDPVVEVQPGRTSTCARTVAGEVWCWGRLVTLPRPMDSAGCEMLAAPDYACPPRLVRRPSGSWTRIGTTAAEAFCAIDDRGSVHCWGLSSLLPADPLGENDPRRMATLSDVASVTVGTNHACAVSAGEVYCWGANEVGQLGIGAADETIHLVPERVMW